MQAVDNVGRADRGEPSHDRRSRRCLWGFTLVELMIVLALIGALAGIAIPQYRDYRDRANTMQAIKDISVIAQAIRIYYDDNRTYPASLTQLGMTLPKDPWGRDYLYLTIDVEPPPNTGQKRKDKNQNPLNSDYDLYSMGPDGQTQKQLTAAKARDDIVRANNGRFIDVASKH